MEGYKCDICGKFYAKPIKKDTLFDLSHTDFYGCNTESKQICVDCLSEILIHINEMIERNY